MIKRIAVARQYIVERQSATGFQDTMNLFVEVCSIGDVHDDVLCPDEIKAGVRKRQVECVRALTGHTVSPDSQL